MFQGVKYLITVRWLGFYPRRTSSSLFRDVDTLHFWHWMIVILPHLCQAHIPPLSMRACFAFALSNSDLYGCVPISDFPLLRLIFRCCNGSFCFSAFKFSLLRLRSQFGLSSVASHFPFLQRLVLPLRCRILIFTVAFPVRTSRC